MLYSHECATSFALSGGGNDVFECQAHHVNWCILNEVVVFVRVVSEYEPYCRAGSIFWENKVNGICFADENHVTCVIPEGYVWVLVYTVHEHLEFLVGVFLLEWIIWLRFH